MEDLDELLCSLLLPAALTALSLFFLFYLKGAPFRRPTVKNPASSSKKFRSVALALAGTLGVGNVTGIADALRRGGPGVLFWMWISSFAAMIVKYAEVVLLMHHKKRLFSRGELPRSPLGPMIYMKPPGAEVLFSLLGLCTGLTVGGGVQATAVSGAGSGFLGIPAAVSCAAIALPALIFILKGKRSLFALTSFLVPAASLLFVGACLVVIVKNAAGLPGTLASIFKGAFGGDAALHGSLAGAVTAMRFGIIRGLISNEAGCGTSPIAHAYSDASPHDQGRLGTVEVAIDTLLLCTLCGLMILLSRARLDPIPSVTVRNALRSVFGRTADVCLYAALFVFAFATLLCWSLYIECFASRLFLKLKRRDAAVKAAQILFCLFVSLSFLAGEELLWKLSDFFTAGMTLFNLAYLFIGRKELASEIPGTRKKSAASRGSPPDAAP